MTLKANINSVCLFLTFFICFSCTESGEKEKANSQEKKRENAENLDAGLGLLEKNCFTCHSPNPNARNKIAPAISAV
ncbi:MAG: hypothetical protein LC664_12385, partial [Flavobacteriales bacterium]|nr:hypothetical protein [Flavobacteriales bacterium]